MNLEALVFLIIVIGIGRSCQTHTNQKDEVRSSAETMLQAYHAAIAEKGLTAEFDYLDDSPDFFWVPPGFTSALDYDSVRSILESNAGMYRSVEFHWDTLQVFPLTKDIATFSGIVSGRMVEISGTESHVNILESGTLIRRADGWKLLSGQSRNLAGPGQE